MAVLGHADDPLDEPVQRLREGQLSVGPARPGTRSPYWAILR